LIVKLRRGLCCPVPDEQVSDATALVTVEARLVKLWKMCRI
jgi:hypothetical protein